jgi:uridylate kinase
MKNHQIQPDITKTGGESLAGPRGSASTKRAGGTALHVKGYAAGGCCHASGGNLGAGGGLDRGMDRATADYCMLGTMMNALALMDAMEVPACTRAVYDRDACRG